MHVVAVGAGVALDLHADARVLGEDVRGPVEYGEGRREQLVRVQLELDVADHPGELLDLFGDVVWAAVLVLEPVAGLLVVGAAVHVVQEAVAVVVDVGAAVVVLPAVLVLPFVGATVHGVVDAVGVVVPVGAAVGVLEAVPILGIRGALVGLVQDAVLVRVVLRTAVLARRGRGLACRVGAVVLGVQEAVPVVVQFGAAVLIVPAVLVLGLQGAVVPGVLDPVPVVVQLGAAVAVLVAVLVLGVQGAAVLGVQHAVGVIVQVGAAVLVLEPVRVLRIHLALVQLVGDAVLVVVQLRAAVRVLVAVQVLGDLLALVHVVRDAVAVGVELASDEHEERAGELHVVEVVDRATGVRGRVLAGGVPDGRPDVGDHRILAQLVVGEQVAAVHPQSETFGQQQLEPRAGRHLEVDVPRLVRAVVGRESGVGAGACDGLGALVLAEDAVAGEAGAHVDEGHHLPLGEVEDQPEVGIDVADLVVGLEQPGGHDAQARLESDDGGEVEVQLGVEVHVVLEVLALLGEPEEPSSGIQLQAGGDHLGPRGPGGSGGHDQQQQYGFGGQQGASHGVVPPRSVMGVSRKGTRPG